MCSDMHGVGPKTATMHTKSSSTILLTAPCQPFCVLFGVCVSCVCARSLVAVGGERVTGRHFIIKYSIDSLNLIVFVCRVYRALLSRDRTLGHHYVLGFD